MIQLYRGSGIIIPNIYKDTEFYYKIRGSLTRRSREYNTSNYIIQKFYLETNDGHLLIPRFFPVGEYIKDYNIIDQSDPGLDIYIKHNIKPKNKLQEEAIQHMLINDSAVMELQPGVGKTVISIAVMATRKKKSFILVHRDSLVDQWKERLLTFTDLEDDNISRLGSSTFDEDLQKPIVIATAQAFISLLKRKREIFLKALKTSNFGVFIADEVHTSVGAPTFSECSMHLPSKVAFGLSATPYRIDGNEDIIQFHLGEIFARDDDTGTMSADVTIILYDYQVDTPRRYRYLRWEGKFQRARYLNLIKKSEIFMNLNRSLLNKIQKDGRNYIYIAERVKLLDELFEFVKSEDKGKFYGSAKKDQLEYKNVFSTPGKVRDGVDAPHKDCVVMTSPISNISQLSGRVVREAKGKDTPVIIDQVDTGCPDISKTIYNRIEYYRKKGWKVNFIFVTPKCKMIKIDEDQAINIIKGE